MEVYPGETVQNASPTKREQSFSDSNKAPDNSSREETCMSLENFIISYL